MKLAFSKVMKLSQIYKKVRKPMPQPTAVMDEGKRKNAYSRKEKHKKNFDFGY